MNKKWLKRSICATFERPDGTQPRCRFWISRKFINDNLNFRISKKRAERFFSNPNCDSFLKMKLQNCHAAHSTDERTCFSPVIVSFRAWRFQKTLAHAMPHPQTGYKLRQDGKIGLIIASLLHNIVECFARFYWYSMINQLIILIISIYNL